MMFSDSERINLDKHEVKENRLWWQEKGLSYTRSGYGKKIPTAQMVKIGSRWHRIYCIIYSNIGTCYVVREGQKVVVA